jgi:hypothetical protein
VYAALTEQGSRVGHNGQEYINSLSDSKVDPKVDLRPSHG